MCLVQGEPLAKDQTASEAKLTGDQIKDQIITEENYLICVEENPIFFNLPRNVYLGDNYWRRVSSSIHYLFTVTDAYMVTLRHSRPKSIVI